MIFENSKIRFINIYWLYKIKKGIKLIFNKIFLLKFLNDLFF